MVTEQFINECKNDAYENRLGKVIVEGLTEEITEENYLSSFTVNSGCYVDGSIIGSVYVKSANCQFVDLTNVALVDKDIQLQAGVLYDDGSTEYLNLGTFKVEKPKDEKTSDNSSITAYDHLLNKLDGKYVCAIDFTEDKTIADLYADVCNQLELEPKTLEFLNSNIPLTDNPFTNNETNRFVLQTICKVACSFIEIDVDTNQIDLAWLSQNSEPDYVFDEDDYSTFEGGDVVFGPVNSVTIKNSQVDDENITKVDEESIATNGEHSIIINEDYLLYDADLRTMAIENIYERLKGLTYVNCKLVTYYGKPFLKIGSKIRVSYNNVNYDSYVLTHTFMYDGTFQSTIECPVLTAQQVATKQPTTLAEKLRNVQIIVNKQDGTIKLINDSISSQGESIGTLVEQMSDKVSITVYEEQIKATNESLSTMNGTISQMTTQFTTDGLLIGKTGVDINSQLDNAGLKIYNLSKLIAIFNQNGSGVEKLIVTKSIQLQNLLLKKGKKETKRHGTLDVIQGFWVEDLIETLKDLGV